MLELPVSLINQSVSFVKIGVSTSPDGSFGGYTGCRLHDYFKVTLTPLLLSGKITLQFTNCDGTDKAQDISG